MTTWELLKILDFLLVSCSETHLYATAMCYLYVFVCECLTITLGLDFLPRKY